MKKLQSKILVTVLIVTMVSTMLTFSSVQASPIVSTIITNRISGVDRYATADELSKKFTTVDTVIIASGEKFPDALCAAPLSKQYDSPILLSSSTSLTKETLAEIARLKATKAIIIGGTGVISLEVEKQLTSAGVTSTRIGAKDRYETSLLVARKLNAPTDVVITSGENFPDALSISGIAAQLNMPVILIGKNGLSTDSQTYINGIRATNTYIVGGLGVISKNIEAQVANPIRLSGADRYETNIKVLDQFKSVLNLDNVFLATGKDFADALSGSALASKSSSPVILTGNNLTPQQTFFNKNSTDINKITVLGGAGVVTNATVASLIYNSTIVVFKDKNLEQVVRKAINKPTGVILKSEVNKITHLEGYGMSIGNLSGLENFTNLTRLSLNPSTNDMDTADSVNISALKGLTNLTTLCLNYNKITDYTPVSSYYKNLIYSDFILQ
jgi:putative cell wall-binding protein